MMNGEEPHEKGLGVCSTPGCDEKILYIDNMPTLHCYRCVVRRLMEYEDPCLGCKNYRPHIDGQEGRPDREPCLHCHYNLLHGDRFVKK
jgi:hypothetical protein